MVNGFLYANAACRPDHAALVFGERRIGHAELLDRVERTAHGLAARGIGTGDAVALVLPNGPEFVTTFFAIAGLGAVVVPLNPQFQPDELTFCLRACGARTVVADRPPVVAGEDRVQWLTPRELLGSASLALEIASGDEPLVYQFSSGSTGRPKRLARTHAQLWAEAETYTWVRPDDRLFCAIPLFHTYAMGCCMIAAVRNGATLVFLDDAHPFVLSRRRALDLLESEAVTVFPGVPLTFRLLAEAPGEADLSALRLCFSAGTALPRPTFDAFAVRFGVPIRQLYGSTETGTLTANLDDDPAASFASVGRPVGDVRVEIRGDGEIAVSSPAMTRGYADLDELNQRVFRDGWYLTGDVGRVDDDGRLFVTGRRKLLIEVAGHKVDPVEVEDVVAAHPKVREAVVVAVAGGHGGEETVKAVVVAGDGCGEQEVIEFCRARLANFKVPRMVEFRDEIPKSPLGKILRKYLV
jgi:long-chain acyl-CoA synthetase